MTTQDTSQPCPFCALIRDDNVFRWIDNGWKEPTAVIVPLNPVVEGHLLVVSKEHATDAIAWPSVTGKTMEAAATLAREFGKPCNLITSVGEAATQTVPHLHIHYVPREEDDGLKLPWSEPSDHRETS